MPQVLSRRSLVAALSSASLTGALANCRGSAGPAGAGPKAALRPVLVSPDRVIRRVAGLRPYRRTGFRVEAERVGEKTLVHNYGHGGCGVTLSWGTASLVLPMALGSGERTIAVLGAGAVGLATARLLQDHGAERVTIYARELPPDTTSNIAGAYWGPYTIAEFDRRTDAFNSQFVAASRYAWKYFQTLAGERYGVRWVPSYFPAPHRDREIGWEESLIGSFLPPYETLGPGEHPFPTPYAHRTWAVLIETPRYLAAVLQDFRLAGGRIMVREFSDLTSILALEERTIVNCTGLGAARLCSDDQMVPIKGQLEVLVPQPEVDYTTIGPMNAGVLYMFPRRDGILLGGTHQEGEWSLEPDQDESARILRQQASLFQSMRGR